MRSKLPIKKPRTRAQDGPAFLFLNSSVAFGAQVFLEATDGKSVVRRRAARVGRRRNTATSKAQSAEVASQGQSQCSPPPESKRDKQHEKTLQAIVSPGPVSYHLSFGYETFRLEHRFDITDLDTFTNVDLATNAYCLLLDKPSRVACLLQERKGSFLVYLPSRYGSCICLDDAMHCVAARAAQMLGLQLSKHKPYELYGRALRSLQNAIGGEVETTISDIYCTTRLLVLYEVSHFVPDRQ